MEEKYFKQSIADIEKQLKTNIQFGLGSHEVLDKQKKYGLNVIKEAKKKTFLQKFIEQIGDFMVLTLLGAAILSFILGEHSEAILIFLIVVINAVLGIIQENKAERALEAIKQLSSPHALVIRNNQVQTIMASELVVGDIIIVEAGDYIPADTRLFEIHSLKVDESTLTGESVPVEKSIQPIESTGLAIGDLMNCAFMGTAVTYGSGKGIVVSTGMETEIGNIAKMLNDVHYMQTPIQKSLEKLGKVLLFVILFICAIIFYVGIKQELAYFDMFIIVVSLAVAAIPEGLPAIVTIVLAIGMQRMVKRNALIRKLPAVETLGSTNVICTDKTGTLTQNKMTVKEVYIDQQYYNIDTAILGKNVQQLATFSVLCNNTQVILNNDTFEKVGDPTEIAMVDLAIHANLDPIQINDQYKRVYEFPFESERKLMSTVHLIGNRKVVITKGAPEVVFSRCKSIYINNQLEDIKQKHTEQLTYANNKMTKKALRVIAVSYKMLPQNALIKDDQLEHDMTFIGLIGMIDPPRPEVKGAIEVCTDAGIETIMITGDHKNTAIAIAKQLDILLDETQAISGSELDQLSDEAFGQVIDRYRVYARVSPEHKVRIVKAWQKKKKVVAMTGDGVNDAPALKHADIGIAMGLSGTEVAKGAADMVLTDDNFATIVKAVEEGRTIFSNIKKSVRFLMSCNIGEILTIFLGTLLGQLFFSITVTPLSAVQLLWANLVTDSLIAIAIGLERAEPNVMKQKHIKHTILDLESFIVVLFQGLLIGTLSFTAFYIGFNMGVDQKSSLILGQTMAFMTLSISELFHAFNLRSERYSIFKIGIFSNKYIIYAFLVSGLLQVGTMLFPFSRRLFHTVLLTPEQCLIVLGLSIVPIVVVEFGKLFGRDPKAIPHSKLKNTYLVEEQI